MACAIPLRAVRDRGALVRRFSGAQFGAVSSDRAAQGTAEIVGMCGVRECAQVCVGYLLETRVLTLADFNMYPIRIFYYIHTEFPSKMAKKLFPIQFKMFQ